MKKPLLYDCKRIEELCRRDRFEEYLAVYKEKSPFSGPSVYFYERMMEYHENLFSIHDILHDECALDTLYALLIAWGLHRMGKTAVKLRAYDDFKNSLQYQGHVDILKKWEGHSLINLSDEKFGSFLTDAWSLINSFKIGESVGKRLVPNSKVLHNLWPDLVPPVDTTYTLVFFFGTGVYKSEEQNEIFQHILKGYRKIATSTELNDVFNCEGIETDIGYGITKMIDNAIIGWVLKNIKKL